MKLERWFLKTRTNVAFGRRYPIFKPNQPEWHPPNELVEIAFGRRRFEPRAGLYLVAGQVGDNVTAGEKFQIVTFTDIADRLAGARFLMFGFSFVIYLYESGLDRRINFQNQSANVSLENVMYHPHAIRYTTGSGQPVSHILEITW